MGLNLQLNQLPNKALCADVLVAHNTRDGNKTYNQTEQVVKHRNRLGNDPSDSPSAQGNSNPGSECERAVLVHVVGALATEDANINVLAGNVTEDNTGNNNLWRVRKNFDKLKKE